MKIVLLIILFVAIGIVGLALGNYLGYKMQENFDLADEEQRVKDKQLLIFLREKVHETDEKRNHKEITNREYKIIQSKIIEQVELLEDRYLPYD